MSQRFPRSNFVQGGFYHTLASGNRNQEIFMDTKDYKRFLEKINEYKKRHDISLIAYCLLPTSISLLTRQNGPQPLNTFLQRLHTAYSMYFNKRHKFTGHLFENKYKVKNVSRNEYLAPVSKYIHLRAQTLVKRLPAHKWSSYNQYINADSLSFVETDHILSQFKRRNQTQEDAKLSYKLFIRSRENYSTDIEKILFN